MVAEVGVSQIVYGTDYPYPWPVGVDFILNASFLSDADKEAILGGNLVRLLRIDPERQDTRFAPGPASIIVVEDWAEELRRRVLRDSQSA